MEKSPFSGSGSDRIALLHTLVRIVEAGSHDELLERKGAYYQLYNAQLQ